MIAPAGETHNPDDLTTADNLFWFKRAVTDLKMSAGLLGHCFSGKLRRSETIETDPGPMRERPNTGTGWRKLVLGPGVGNLDTFPLSIACALRFLTQFCFSWLPLAKFWRYIPIFHNHFAFAIVDSATKSKPFLL